MTPLITGLGAPELGLVVAVLLLMFGASKLPDIARNSGRALKIFKAETTGLLGDESSDVQPAKKRREPPKPDS